MLDSAGDAVFNLTPLQIQEICTFAHISDREIRSDLSRGIIRDEDDYTSNFTGSLRRKINSYSITGLQATSKLLSTTLERSIGCDAAIIVESNGYVKVAVFEGKYPRIKGSTSGTKWDTHQGKSANSHFSDQLRRQASWNSSLAIFEMFYCEYPFFSQPHYMNDDVSSCVWHTEAASYDAGRLGSPGPWSIGELASMLTKHGTNIADVLQSVCECKKGKALRMTGLDAVAQEFGIAGEVLYISGENSQFSQG